MADNDGSSGLRDLMPGVFSGIASALTAIAGILGLLHEGGYFANRAPAATVVASARAPGQLAVSASDSAVSQGTFFRGPAAPAGQFPRQPGSMFHPRRPSVVGAWRDGAGVGCHVISQYGNQLVVNNYDGATGAFRATGLGTARGRNIHLHMNKLNPAAPEVQLVLSDDGHELAGMMQFKRGQAHIVLWHYSGPNCVQAATQQPFQPPREAAAPFAPGPAPQSPRKSPG